MSKAKPVSTPMASGTHLITHSGDHFTDPHYYRSIIGSLQYLSFTRPDITFAVNRVCQFMDQPKQHHWTAVKIILRYLRGTSHYALHLKPSPSSNISAFSDADWGGNPDDCRSTAGFAIYFGPNLVAWSSKKQPTVARSSTEAEYKAVATTASELIWVQNLLHELHIYLPDAPSLHCDNLGATYLVANPVFHSRAKHIALDYHFVRERQAAGLLNILHISSKDQIADILTKPLPSSRFGLLRSSLTVLPAHFHSRDSIEAQVTKPK